MSTTEGTSLPFAFLWRFLTSSIGAKWLMAATGVVMWGFLLGHMAGNLLVFVPPAATGYWGQTVNEYAQALKSNAPLLWGTRVTLLGALTLHVVSGIRLARLNRAARPARYQSQRFQASSIFSRTMALSGILVLFFIVMHIAHFTLGAVTPGLLELRDQAGLHDVFAMMRGEFAKPLFVGVYLVAMTLVLGHLIHGSQSAWQSIGITHPSWRRGLRLLGWAVVAVIVLGKFVIVIGVWTWSLQA